ncbi:MAG: ACT domain-containing protein [Myxococcota bacterium]
MKGFWMKSWVITAVGPDRPGLVGRLTAPLQESDSNLADSRMINLRGQFAVLLLAEVPDECEVSLRKALEGVAAELGLRLEIHVQEEARSSAHTVTVGVPYRLRIFAMDQPGIVHRITDVLQRASVNVEELETRSEPRPQSGAPLFSLELRMTVPAEVGIRELRASLTAVCDELNCDLELVRASLT